MAKVSREITDPLAGTDRIRAEQILVLHQTAPVGLFAALIAAFLLAGALVYVEDTPLSKAAIWLAFATADFTCRQLLCLAYFRDRPAQADWRPAARRFTAACLLGGLIWGLGAVWLMMPGNIEQQLLIVVIVSATASGAIPSFGSYLPATYAYFVPAILPYILWGPLTVAACACSCR